MNRIPIALLAFAAVATAPAWAHQSSSYEDDRDLYSDVDNTNVNRNANRNKNVNANRNQNNNSVRNHNSNRQQQAQGQAQGQFQSNRVRNAGNNTGNSASASNSSASNQATQNNANAATGNVTNTAISEVHQAQARNPVATAAAAPLTSANDSCMGSTSMGAQGVTLGLSVGSTWTDSNCVMLKNATMLWNMGRQDAAIALMCKNDQVREALESSGTECPQTRHERDQAKRATYDTSDPYIAARMRRTAGGQ